MHKIYLMTFLVIVNCSDIIQVWCGFEYWGLKTKIRKRKVKAFWSHSGGHRQPTKPPSYACKHEDHCLFF